MTAKIVVLLLLHFIADFPLQSREMGKKKSQESMWLLQHLIIQFFVVYMGSLFIMDAHIAFRLALLNAIVHGIIDWNIWRGYKYSVKYRLLKTKREDVTYASPTEWDMATMGTEEQYLTIAGRNWKYWEDHMFYTTIGFDQMLHGITLVLLAGWLT
jgi:hypothetical protein